MMIDWLSFTPGSALAGGALIGLAAAMFVLFTGRIAGISGILGGLLRRPATGAGWRIAFLGGLVLAPVVYGLATDLPQRQIDAGWAGLVAAGLLVGVGTRYGAGCTSGHGVCGISRLSLRSLVATAVFMGAGILTVSVARHLLTA